MGVTIHEHQLRDVIVVAEDATTGLEVSECSAAVDGQDLGSATAENQRLVFSTKEGLGTGTHTLIILLSDQAGNRSLYEAHFNLDPTTTEQDEALQKEEQYWSGRREDIGERLAKETELRKRFLTDPRLTMLELGLPFTKEAARTLPPALPETHADFILRTASDTARGVLKDIRARLAETLTGNGELEEMSQIWKWLEERMTPHAGPAPEAAFETLSLFLQDPFQFLGRIGVTLSEEEKANVFPPLPKDQADAMVQWILAREVPHSS